MENTLKLYKVTLRGMTSSSSGRIYGVSYVVSHSMDEAYKKVQVYLDENDIGYEKERTLDRIELIAEADESTNVQHMLFCDLKSII